MALRSQFHHYKNITLAAPTTTVVKTGPGYLHTVTLNKGATTGTATIYDGVDATGTVIGVITGGTAIPVSLHYDVQFTTGLTIVTATAAMDLTVSFG